MFAFPSPDFSYVCIKNATWWSWINKTDTSHAEKKPTLNHFNITVYRCFPNSYSLLPIVTLYNLWHSIANLNHTSYRQSSVPRKYKR